LEIEAKYTLLDEACYRRLAELRDLAGFRVEDRGTRHLYDTYYDTADGRIATAGYACRHRLQDGQSLITIKGLGAAAANVHQREELESDLGAVVAAVPDHWPDCPARDLVQQIAGSHPLGPLLAIVQTRRVRSILDANGTAMAELCLDHARCATDRDECALEELEIEMAPGTAFHQLQTLTATLQTFGGLAPQFTSKFERAVAALCPRAPVGVALGYGEIRPAMTIGQATQRLLRLAYQEMQNQEADAYRGKNLHALQKMHHAVERMLLSYTVAAPGLSRELPAGARAALRAVARALSSTMHLAKLLARVNSRWCEGAPPSVIDAKPSGWSPRLRSLLVSRRYQQLKQVLWSSLSDPLPDRQTPTLVREAVRATGLRYLRDFEPRLAAATSSPAPSQPQLAALRISAQQLVLTLDTYADILDPIAGEALSMLNDLLLPLDEQATTTQAIIALEAVVESGVWPRRYHGLRSYAEPIDATTARSCLVALREEGDKLDARIANVCAQITAAGVSELARRAVCGEVT
jgi:hypothetical protein